MNVKRTQIRGAMIQVRHLLTVDGASAPSCVFISTHFLLRRSRAHEYDLSVGTSMQISPFSPEHGVTLLHDNQDFAILTTGLLF